MQCEIRREVGIASRRAYFEDVRTTNDQLVAAGMDWAKHRAVGEARDMPSRRAAFELASKALGRRANSHESVVVQRAAREFRRQVADASLLALNETVRSSLR